MAFRIITYRGRNLSIHKAIVNPSFAEKTVLVTSTWEYVSLWLRRRQKRQALFFWEQARQFYQAARELPLTSSPLTSYYSFLNATKALLVARGVPLTGRVTHGVGGTSIGERATLSNEQVEFVASGVLAELCRFLGEPLGGQYTLKDLLYNLPYIHRSFNLTFRSQPELFIPLTEPLIVRSKANNEAWFSAYLRGRYANKHVLEKLPNQFERDIGSEGFVVRSRRRFTWNPRNKTASVAALRPYHAKLRKDLYYIHSPQRLWYLKRGGNVPGLVDRSSLAITFAAMHRLSELCRYEPARLARHLDGQHNWLLSEFIRIAPPQFLDEISAELTGLEFMIPGRAT